MVTGAAAGTRLADPVDDPDFFLTVPLNQSPRPLPPVAARVDAALRDIDDRIDWLRALTPLGFEALWRTFADSGYEVLPEPVYPPQDPALPDLRRRLLALPVDRVEEPALEALLWEKQRELDRRIELVLLRCTPGLLVASIDLWGDAEPDLVVDAQHILHALGEFRPLEQHADWREVQAEAERQITHYREHDPSFGADIVIEDDLSSKLMVSPGKLHIARSIRAPRAQVHTLVQHHVGSHLLTRHNGSKQPFGQLEVGLAHYDALQEGLGVLTEYLAGYLPPGRMRILAARVVATQQICQGIGIVDIFHHLTGEYFLTPRDAFDVALRAGRGGGLTKDVVYLRGLRDLLHYLRGGGSLEFLFIGKFALTQVPVLRDLERVGFVEPPALLPSYLEVPAALQRLEHCRRLSLLTLATEELLT